MRLDLYLDITNKKLVQGPQNGSPFTLPRLFREDNIQLGIQLLERNATGGLSAPYSVLDITALTIEIGLGSEDKGVVSRQQTWTKDEVNDRFIGVLDLWTTAIQTAFATTTDLTRNYYLEIKVKENGYPYTAFKQAVTLERNVLRQTAVDPDLVADPSDLADAIAGILRNSKTLIWTQVGSDLTGDVYLQKLNLNQAPVSDRLDDLNCQNYRFVRLTGPTADFDLTGIVQGTEGQTLTLYNATGYDMTIKHDSANSSEKNRIYCFQNMCYATPADAVIVCRGIADFIYDATDDRWLLRNYIGT